MNTSEPNIEKNDDCMILTQDFEVILADPVQIDTMQGEAEDQAS